MPIKSDSGDTLSYDPNGVYNPNWYIPPPMPAWMMGQGKWNGKEWVWRKPPLPGTDTNPGNPGDGGGGGGGGGGGAGGGATGLSAYIQEYRIRFRTEGTPPPGLLSKAKTNNWSIAYFDMQVRLHDPTYFRSKEAQVLLPKFNKTMKVLFPGLSNKSKQAQLFKSSFYKKTALWYLKNGVGLSSGGGVEALYGRITNTSRWKQQNPYWKDYAKNRNIGVASESNPILYKQYLDVLKQSFTDQGIADLPDGYYHTFFQSRYASKTGISDMQTNLKNYSEQGASYGWWQGEKMTSGQTKTAILGDDSEAAALKRRLAKSFGTQKSFLGSEQKNFDSQLTNQGKLVKPLI